MAYDLNKNITIQVTAQTDQLEQSINNLNKLIDSLLAKQKQLIDTGNQNSAAFQNNADKIDIFQKSLASATTQLNAYLSALSSSASALQKNQSLITALTVAKDKYSKSVGDNSKKVNELNAAIKSLSGTAQQHQTQTEQSGTAIDNNTKSLSSNVQQASDYQDSLGDVNDALKQQKETVEDNKTAFDAHKLVMDHLKTSFDEIKNISGEFGPSLQDAAQGFNLMKSGLAVVKDGLYGVGDALKADGFDFLLQILQQIFDAFVHSSEGTKVLQGAISAIGVVVNKVKAFFSEFMDGIIKAVSHPIDSIKELGRMVEQNIINRFTAFSKILDGLIHLDFKKVADGAIQAVTGITDTTGKIVAVVKSAGDAIAQTGTEIGKAYTEGFKQAAKAKDDFQKQTKTPIKIKKASLKTPANAPINTNDQVNGDIDEQDTSTSTPTQPSPDAEPNAEFAQADLAYQQQQADKQEALAKQTTQKIIADANQQKAENKKIQDAARKAHNKEIVNEASQTAQQVSSAAFSILINSIKQQSDAKLAALDQDKTAELSNSSLTSAQRLAIEQKYKDKEKQVKVKAFKDEQEASLAQAVINGALAVTKATSQTGVLSAFVVPEIIAETAIQVATIVAQKPPAYATGGLHYTSDGRGGVLPGYSRADNTNAYLRSGEGIIVSEAMRAPWARNLVSAINVGFGGQDFSVSHTGRGYAVGGIFTDGGDANRYYNAPVNDQKNLANSIAYQMVNNFPPVYVDVKDINNQQNILAQTINRVNL